MATQIDVLNEIAKATKRVEKAICCKNFSTGDLDIDLDLQPVVDAIEDIPDHDYTGVLQQIEDNTDNLEPLITNSNTKLDTANTNLNSIVTNTNNTATNVSTVNTNISSLKTQLTQANTNHMVVDNFPVVPEYNLNILRKVTTSSNNLVINGNSVHSISITVVSGEATIEFNSTPILVPEGYSCNMTATTTLSNTITISVANTTDLVVVVTTQT